MYSDDEDALCKGLCIKGMGTQDVQGVFLGHSRILIIEFHPSRRACCTSFLVSNHCPDIGSSISGAPVKFVCMCGVLVWSPMHDLAHINPYQRIFVLGLDETTDRSECSWHQIQVLFQRPLPHCWGFIWKHIVCN